LIPENGIWGKAYPGIGWDREFTKNHPNPAQRNY
jgi:hypothetical protein